MRKLVVTLAGCILLAGCSGNATSNSKDTFTVGMECNYAPFNWQTSAPRQVYQLVEQDFVMDTM